MDQALANHSYVNISLIGRPDIQDDYDGSGDSVGCLTDLTSCCSGEEGIHRGDWYFPNGTRLPTPQGTGVFEARYYQRVDLRRNYNYSTSGIYHCDIPTIAVHDDNDTSVTDRPVYVGLYTGEGGTSKPHYFAKL